MMRLFIPLAAACVLAVAPLAACSPQDGSATASNAGAAQKSQAANAAAATAQQATSAPQADDVRRVTQEELRAGLESGTVALFDVRDQASYDAGHIKGAKLVPHDDVEKRLDEFPKDKLIVTYCA
jgi:3-mercaptopyruvate sulfurtransferase SseA